MRPDFGALVISLDFEIHWGVRDHSSITGPYRANLLGVRRVVPALLEIFREFDVAATWATVGLLFARSRAEADCFRPKVLPSYERAVLSPFDEPVGEGEEDDPFHYAPSLVDAIAGMPRQEIASHTYSHYYCLEPGQTAESFKADLDSAIAIARTRGLELRSIVFPRNQRNPRYDALLLQAGITCQRGNQPSWIYDAREGDHSALHRGARLVDAYANVGGSHCIPWAEVIESSGLANVRASFYLRPYSHRLRPLEKARIRRITGGLEHAAREGKIVHLWWHPHNFGVFTDENLAALRAILDVFARCRDSYGMRSLTMHEAGELARE